MKVILTTALQRFQAFFLLLFLLGLFPGAAVVKAQEGFSLKILDIRSNGRGAVHVIISAADASGLPIKGLNPSNLKLNIEALSIRDFKMETVSSAKNPLSVLLAMDVSGSMKGMTMDSARKAAITFVDRLAREDYAALITFGSGTRMVHEFTANKASVRQSLDTLAADEKDTRLYDATFESLQQASGAPTSRVAIVLLTDGKDEGSAKTDADVLARIRGVRIPVYTLGFGENAQRPYLEEIARASGGSFFYAPEAGVLEQLYAQVYEQLENQYQIEFPFAEPAGEYVATLTLTRGGSERTVRASFIQAIAGAPAARETQVFKGWPIYTILGMLAVLVVLSLVTFAVHLRSGKKTSDPSETQVEIMINGKRSLLSIPAQGSNSKMTVVAQTPTGEAGFMVQLPNAPAYLPLVDNSIGRKYEEVIITRFDPSSKFRREKIYLLISDRSVSRPDRHRIGHASISLNPKSGRYQIKDLGSIGGTRLHGIRLGRPAYLENGDAITIGTVSLKYYDMRSGGMTS